jgi:hypothetical protein
MVTAGIGTSHRRAFRLAAYIVFAVVVGGIGYLVASKLPGSEEGRAFRDLPETFIWISLITAQAALWALLFIYLLGQLRPWAADDRRWISWSIPAVLIVVGASFLAWNNRTIDSPLRWQHERVALLTVLGLVMIGPGLVTVFVVADLARERAKSIVNSSRRELRLKRIPEVLRMRETLSRMLFIIGFVVGIATLTTGALRNAVLAADRENLFQDPHLHRPVSLPVLYPVLYGALLTAIMALIFLPAHWAVDLYARKIVESVLPPTDPAPRPEWFADYTNLSNHLGLSANTLDVLRNGSAILAPLIASIAGTLFAHSG